MLEKYPVTPMRYSKSWIYQNFRRYNSSTNPECLNAATKSAQCQRGQRNQERDRTVNAFVSYADSSRTFGIKGKDAPLLNRQIALKDNICTKSLPTTCSSAMLLNYTSPFDATVVALLREAGAEIVGKTNCDEFGMGSFNVHSVHGPVINPYQTPSEALPWTKREERSPGGSSGGSAAAVAADMCYAALSTDTGGSTRLPAAYCGIVGLKPSYGIVSRWGVVSFADSLDCVGIMAKKVADVASVYRVLSAHDPRDPTAADPDLRDKAQRGCQRALESFNAGSACGLSNLQGLIIGVPQEYFPKELGASSTMPLRRILYGMKSLGATIIPVSLSMTPYALSAYYVIASAEASSNMARYDGIQYGLRSSLLQGSDRAISNVYANTRTNGFGHEVQKRILLGTYSLSSDAFDNYFLQAQRVRELIKADFERVFSSPNALSTREIAPQHGVDVLLHPSAISTAPRLADSMATTGVQAYVQDILTVPASLAGLPAMSVPAGLGADNWPVGVSIVGQWGHDDMVLKVGQVIERLLPSVSNA